MKTISIETVRPHIEIKSTKAKLEVVGSTRRGMKISRSEPELNVEHKQPTLKIDWKAYHADRGTPTPEYMRRGIVQDANQDSIEATQRFVREGDEFGNLQNYAGSGGPVGQMARRELIDPLPEINVRSTVPPDISWDPADMKLNWENVNDIKIEWDKYSPPEIKVTPHSVEIRVVGRPEVRITVNEDNVPKIQGKAINTQM